MGRPFAYLRKSRVNNLDVSLAPETQERTVREMAQRFGDNGDRLHVLADWDICGAAKYTRKRAGLPRARQGDRGRRLHRRLQLQPVPARPQRARALAPVRPLPRSRGADPHERRQHRHVDGIRADDRDHPGVASRSSRARSRANGDGRRMTRPAPRHARQASRSARPCAPVDATARPTANRLTACSPCTARQAATRGPRRRSMAKASRPAAASSGTRRPSASWCSAWTRASGRRRAVASLACRSSWRACSGARRARRCSPGPASVAVPSATPAPTTRRCRTRVRPSPRRWSCRGSWRKPAAAPAAGRRLGRRGRQPAARAELEAERAHVTSLALDPRMDRTVIDARLAEIDKAIDALEDTAMMGTGGHPRAAIDWEAWPVERT